VPRFAIAPLGLTTEGSTKFKLKGWKYYIKKLQWTVLAVKYSISGAFQFETRPLKFHYTLTTLESLAGFHNPEKGFKVLIWCQECEEELTQKGEMVSRLQAKTIQIGNLLNNLSKCNVKDSKGNPVDLSLSLTSPKSPLAPLPPDKAITPLRSPQPRYVERPRRSSAPPTDLAPFTLNGPKPATLPVTAEKPEPSGKG